MKAVDLFCGAGGWTLAVNDLRMQVRGYDWDGDAIATYAAAGFLGNRVDLSTAPPQQCDLIVASPPCQPYSPAGKRQGRADDRAMLPMVVAQWAELMRPTAIAVEQVEGAAGVINRLAATLATYGYKVALREVNSEQHGVPQARRRIVLMANLHHKPGQPKATHSIYDRRHPRRLQPGLIPWVSMGEALGISDEWAMGDVKTSNGTIRTADQPAGTVMAGMDNGNYRWVHARPSPTIVGSFHPEVVARPVYRTTTSRQNETDSMVVTVQQAAILQGFPPDYPWQGTQSAQYRQVGNAFPPPVAKAVLEALL